MTSAPPIRFTAPAETKSLNWHSTHQARYAVYSRVHTAIRESVAGITPPDWPNIYIQLTRVGPRALDSDNLTGALKPVRDAIAQWLGVDDADTRLVWECIQRKETVLDETPRARNRHRTWVEVQLSHGGSVPAVPGTPPEPLERVRKSPDRPDPTPFESPPAREVQIPRGNGSLRIALIVDDHGSRLRICSHFTQQGHRWRTQGVRVELEEIAALVEALKTLG